MEAIRSSETSVLTTATQRHMSEDGILQVSCLCSAVPWLLDGSVHALFSKQSAAAFQYTLCISPYPWQTVEMWSTARPLQLGHRAYAKLWGAVPHERLHGSLTARGHAVCVFSSLRSPWYSVILLWPCCTSLYLLPAGNPVSILLLSRYSIYDLYSFI
jgi:hypothetical protein